MKTSTQYMAKLENAGWTFWRIGRDSHRLFKCPCGHHIATVPADMSDRRSLRNNIAQVRRCPTMKEFR